MQLKMRMWSVVLAVGLAACGGEVAEEAYDGDAPPPPDAPGLENAATSGPAAPDALDTDTAQVPVAPVAPQRP